MSWQQRFRKIRELADKQEASEKQRIREQRQRARETLKERRKTVKELSPKTEKVCKQFCRGVKAKMAKHRQREWNKVNFGWNLQTGFGGIRVRTWPWLKDPDRPLPVRGLWLQYLGPDGTSVVEERRARGTRLDERENPTASGHYYWYQRNGSAHCTFGYFLSLDGFSEEKLSRNLERIGHDLLRFSSDDFPSVPTEAVAT